MRLGAVQMDIVWHDRAANHAHAWDLAAAAKASDVDLVVFPEMFSTGFSMDTAVTAEAKDGSTPTLLRSMARELNINVVGGFALSEGALNFTGGSAIIDPTGEVIASAGDQETLIIADIEPKRIDAVRSAMPFLKDRKPHFLK